MSGDISNQTTNFSNVSVSGTVAANQFASTGTFTGSGVGVFSDVSSTGTVRGNVVYGSQVSSIGTVAGTIGVYSDVSSTNTVRGALAKIGPASGTNAATAITRIAKGNISVVAMTCIANASTTTTATVAGITTADAVFISPPSSMSSGVNVTGFASGNSTIDLIFSNCSTANQVVVAGTYQYVAIRS